jgi:ribosomal protein L40E
LIQQIYKQYARNLNYNHSIRSFAEKTLTIHEEMTMQTLVVTPSFKKNTINAKNLFLQQVCITSSAKNPNRALKNRPCYE